MVTLAGLLGCLGNVLCGVVSLLVGVVECLLGGERTPIFPAK